MKKPLCGVLWQNYDKRTWVCGQKTGVFKAKTGKNEVLLAV
jgi:hypothetical protein